jgi:leader peptidase (prepilin peptidase)/N-methyltransferase
MPPDEILYSPALLAVLGLCIGSFLNVVVHRLPLMLERGWREESAELLGVPVPETPRITLSTPRSRCPSCGHAIPWYENIPLASWLWLRGRCSACKTRISARYPAVEVATAALFAAIGWRFGAVPTTLLWCGFSAVLLAAALIDFDTQLLPDVLTQPLLWAGLIAAARGWIPVSLAASVGGAVVGYLSLWTVATLYRAIRGQEGMAPGDFKLLAALGAWLGWQTIPLIVLLSSAVGAVAGLALIALRNHDRQVPIPFGPYLAGGGIAAMFFGELLVRLWLPRS